MVLLWSSKITRKETNTKNHVNYCLKDKCIYKCSLFIASLNIIINVRAMKRYLNLLEL